MKLSMRVGIVCVALMISVHSFEWTKASYDVDCYTGSCGGKDDTIQNLKVLFTPNPPQLGKDLNITVTGMINKEITKGSKLFAGYSVNGHLKRRFPPADFCEQIAKINMSCPLQPGPLNILVTLPIPDTDLQGDYGAFVNGTDQNGNPLLCIRADCILRQY